MRPALPTCIMNNSTRFGLALGSLLSFTAACSGSASTVDDPAPPAATTASPSSPPPATPAPTSPAADAGAPPPAADAAVPPPPVDAGAPDAHVDPPMPLHCTGTLIEPDVCIENAQGHPGDVVDVDLVLLGSASCTMAGEANGHILFDTAHFTVDNQVEQVACRTRKVGPGGSGSDDLMWDAFGDGSLGGCPSTLPLGKVDTVKVKIAAGTPAGDYKLVWQGAAFIGAMSGPPACTTIGLGQGGTLRVLP